MKTDDEIERERRTLEILLGPTRAGWHAEACKHEVASDHRNAAGHAVMVWACRYREMAQEAAHRTMHIVRLATACRYAAGSFQQVSSEHTVPPIVLHDCRRKLEEALADAQTILNLLDLHALSAAAVPEPDAFGVDLHKE